MDLSSLVFRLSDHTFNFSHRQFRSWIGSEVIPTNPPLTPHRRPLSAEGSGTWLNFMLSCALDSCPRSVATSSFTKWEPTWFTQWATSWNVATRCQRAPRPSCSCCPPEISWRMAALQSWRVHLPFLFSPIRHRGNALFLPCGHLDLESAVTAHDDKSRQFWELAVTLVERQNLAKKLNA